MHDSKVQDHRIWRRECLVDDVPSENQLVFILCLSHWPCYRSAQLAGPSALLARTALVRKRKCHCCTNTRVVYHLPGVVDVPFKNHLVFISCLRNWPHYRSAQLAGPSALLASTALVRNASVTDVPKPKWCIVWLLTFLLKIIWFSFHV